MKRYAEYSMCLVAVVLGCAKHTVAVDECVQRSAKGVCISDHDASSGPPAAVIVIDNLGADGWRQSKTFFCPDHKENVSEASIWSDSRGVFVQSTTRGGSGDGPCHGEAADNDDEIVYQTGNCELKNVYFNDGSGWAKIYDSPSMGELPSQMTGFDNGSLVFFGPDMADLLYGLAYLEDGEIRIEPNSGDVETVFVVNDELAYAVSSPGLLYFDGASWGRLPEIPPDDSGLGPIWANEESLFVEGSGLIMSLADGEWTVHDTRTLESFVALWGFASDDVWAASYDNLHHYDGNEWTAVDWPFDASPSCEAIDFPSPSINGLWGAEGVLYIASAPARLARYKDGEFDLVLDLPCVPDSAALTQGVRILSLWGNSEDEVFVALDDKASTQDPCGPLRLLYFDGDKLHWF